MFTLSDVSVKIAQFKLANRNGYVQSITIERVQQPMAVCDMISINCSNGSSYLMHKEKPLLWKEYQEANHVVKICMEAINLLSSLYNSKTVVNIIKEEL